MHKEQTDWCIAVKEQYHWYFKEKHVLDVGSHDVNGNNRFLFEDCWYIGVDAEDGPGVNRRIDVAKVPFIGRNLAVGVLVTVLEEHSELALGKIDVY